MHTKYDQWISFEDADTIHDKTTFVLDRKLFGAAVYSIENDDISNRCEKGQYPLLEVVNSIVSYGLEAYAVVCENHSFR